jgi:prephenate dehydrogenase
MATITVGILGLGRLGASFGLALKRYAKTTGAQHQFVINGYDELSSAGKEALKMEAIDHDVRSAITAVSKADVVILSARYGLHPDLYELAAPALKVGAVIVDLAPLKQEALKRAEKHLPRDEQGQLTAHMVGATPILNPTVLLEAVDPLTETSRARADLFDGGTLVITPDVDTRGEAVQLIADLATLIGLGVHFVDPAEHDGLITMMETLPLLAGLALFRTAAQDGAWEDRQRFGNPAFALATQGLGQLAPDDAAAFFSGDRAQTLKTLDAYIEALGIIREFLADDDPKLIETAFDRTSARRDEWLAARRKNKWDSKTEVKPTENISVASTLGARFLPRGLRPGDNKPNGNR